MTKPVDAKYGGKKPIVSSVDKSNLNVEMTDVSNKATRPVETTANPKSVHGNQDKQACTIRCKICIESFGSIKELNDHHRADHGIVDCEMCDKKFATQTALDKHMYTHKDLRFICEDCGQSFPFKSRLEQHRITHQADPGFMCKQKGCDHSFKNRGDLNRHINSHDDVWYKCDSYPYKNKDKRNRDFHMRIHQEQGVGLECYNCEKCGKAMRFSAIRKLAVTFVIYMCKHQRVNQV